ncbi:MAG TPA: hypothetical protein VGQ87_02465 [Patescibacteria group bacterium]|nr:hypothetical protein [Patescibacteria group bacterium]
MHTFEIEIKSLLGNKQKADELVNKMQLTDADFKSLGSHKQLNHYFVGGDLQKLFSNIEKYLTEDKQKLLKDIVSRAKDFSLRTRLADEKVILVVKASVDDTTSENGTARLEFEAVIPNLTLDQLDKQVLDSGFTYQAKWSRERQDFSFKGLNVSIDKNAGYGYLAEFETIVKEMEKADEAKISLRKIMQDLGVAELPQDRLARMFDYYNKNWQNFYGTDKTFIID